MQFTNMLQSDTFELFIDNNQCKHVFFAGCHDTAYLPLLSPYKNKLDRITLIKSSGFSNGFKTLSLRIEELPSVFRSTIVEGYSYTNKNSGILNHTNDTSHSALADTKKNNFTKHVCHFFQKVCIADSINISIINLVPRTIASSETVARICIWTKEDAMSGIAQFPTHRQVRRRIGAEKCPYLVSKDFLVVLAQGH
jgi:hypothetical protein